MKAYFTFDVGSLQGLFLIIFFQNRSSSVKEEQRRKKKKEKLGLLHMSRAVITIFSRGRGRRENLAEHVTANAAFSLLRGSWIPSLRKNNRRSVDQGGGYAVKNILAVSFWKEDLYIEGACQVLDLLLLYRPDSCTFLKSTRGGVWWLTTLKNGISYIPESAECWQE